MKLTRESIDRFYDYDLHVESRTIYIGDTGESGVDPDMAAKTIKAFHVLQTANKEPIRVLMNTCGGSITDGMAIYDAIHGCACHVTIEVLGAAMSMGAIILQAADERVIHPSATIMLHDGTMGSEGEAKTFESWAEFSKASRKQMYHIFASRTERTTRYWEKKCASDYILDAKKALSEKLVDRIVGGDLTLAA
jgi:ATP-dependent Clp protease, protease subunit